MAILLGYCQVQDIIDFIPNLRVNSSSDMSTVAIEESIENQAVEIQNIAKYNKYSIPDLINYSPVTNKEYMLFLLNVELPAANLIFKRASESDPQASKMAQIQLNCADNTFERFRLDLYDQSFESVTPLPTTPLTTLANVEKYLPGYTANATSQPTNTVLQRWINMYSAELYCLIARKQYNKDAPIPFTPVSLVQQRLCSRIVTKRAASHLIRTRGQKWVDALGISATEFLKQADEDIENFIANDTDYLWL